VGDLHRAGDAAVVLGVGTEEVGRLPGGEVGFAFQPLDVFGPEDRRIELLPEGAVGAPRDAAVAEGVLVPVEALLIEGAAE